MLVHSVVDLTLSCPSWDTNAAYDIVPIPGPTAHLHPVVMYLGDGLDEYLTHPYASPLFGNFDGLPPLLIQCGEAEVLRDEVMLLSLKASLAGVHVQHEMYEDAVRIQGLRAYPTLIYLLGPRLPGVPVSRLGQRSLYLVSRVCLSPTPRAASLHAKDS